MPSDMHEILLRQLGEIAVRVENALAENDYDALPPLLDEQKQVMQALKAAGPIPEAPSLTALTEARDQVLKTALALESRRDDLAGQLKTAGTKQKIARAYGR